MSLNLWECEHPGCRATAVGTGGAIGLRAIGWFFRMGGGLYCPVHRPDPLPACRETDDMRKPGTCATCAGDDEANRLQVMIIEALHTSAQPSMALVHVLVIGRALCGQPGVPAEWPFGDRWVWIEEWRSATCEKCRRHALDLRATVGATIAQAGETHS